MQKFVSIPAEQSALSMSNPMFSASRLGCFVEALCHCNVQSGAQIHDSVYRCIEAAHISVHDYAVRLGAYMRVSSSVFVVAGVLVHRFWENFPSCFCDLSALKILSTACVIAAKFVEDEVYNNVHYAACAGVTLAELNMMESVFLSYIGFVVFVGPEQFQVAESRLANIDVLLGGVVPQQHVSDPEVALPSTACIRAE